MACMFSVIQSCAALCDPMDCSPPSSSVQGIHQTGLLKWVSISSCRRAIASVQFSRSVVFNSLRPHEPQHTIPPCPSPTTGVQRNPCPLCRWCYPTMSILCHPLLLLPSIFLSIRVFSNELVLRIRGPKFWSFSFNISPSSEHPGLISFRMDWLDLL